VAACTHRRLTSLYSGAMAGCLWRLPFPPCPGQIKVYDLRAAPERHVRGHVAGNIVTLPATMHRVPGRGPYYSSDLAAVMTAL
jgi:hypothetical protein